MYLNGDGIAGKRRPRRAPSPTTTSCSTSTPTAPVDITLPPEEYAEAWDVVDRHRRHGRRRRRCSRPGATFHDASTAACSSCASTPSPTAEPDHSVAASVAAQATAATPQRRDPHARQHLPAADHAVVRPDEAATAAALPARPRRRLGLPLAAARGRARLDARLRRGPARPGRPGPRRRRRGWPRCRPRRGGWAWACSSTSCPTTSASRRRPPTWWWDVLEHGRGPVRVLLRRRLGRRRRAAAARARRRRRGRGRGRRADELATTTYGSRWRPARRRRRAALPARRWRRGDAT